MNPSMERKLDEIFRSVDLCGRQVRAFVVYFHMYQHFFPVQIYMRQGMHQEHKNLSYIPVTQNACKILGA